ncbi:serine hydrolase domain-containing protein [Lachnoclostridium sp. Marseille-P6806]|uniref:serine hydrolase domain-containing protein n=1 Tax=Lachnoclostridium sp. Marseille-P6806 TaxID=2364793 RepID=UPI001030220F|nr:serine hydrolase domain-containing protein [Lachnoclostridium sp. Marseille-P6806]
MNWNEDQEALLKGALEAAVGRAEIAGGNVLLLQEGKELCYAEAGKASIEKNIPFSRDTIVRLYSMSKVVTGAAMMLLAQDGRVDLYDPVEKFIPAFRGQKVQAGDRLTEADRPVNLRDCLSMTSGLCYPGEANRAEWGSAALFDEMCGKLGTPGALTTQEFAARMGKLPLAFQPGSRWQYGTSTDVLGAVIEKVADMPYGDFLKKRLFDPLGMRDTAFSVPEEKRARLASAYTCFGDGSAPELYTGQNLAIRGDGGENPFQSGGAGLFSTIEDMASFARMLAAEGRGASCEILRPGTVRFFRSAGLDGPRQAAFSEWQGLEGHSYGNFVRVLRDPSLAGTLGEKGEFGWDGWLGAYLTIAPESRTVLLMMIQRVDYGTGGLTRKLRNIVFGG